MNTNINDFEEKTTKDIKNTCLTSNGEDSEEAKLCMIEEEFRQGLDSVKVLGPSVTFYGSARLKEDHPDYIRAHKLSYRIAKELGYIVMSGGGAGIMEASNRGAFDAKVDSIGLTIKLPREQHTNPYVTKEIPFRFFFSRQASMSYVTEACIFCAGGFGTLSELCEVLTLLQTGKIGRVPVILFGTEFWTPMQNVFKEILADKYKTISEEDFNFYVITDDEDEVLEIIKKSKMRNGEDALY